MDRLRFGEQHIGEFYHVFNRGNNKRDTFLDKQDVHFFLDLLRSKNKCKETKKPYVSVLAFSILKNHYHLILKQEHEQGIHKFLQRVGTTYVMYFNKKYECTGGLFQGKYKFVLFHKTRLLERISYVNCNHKIHGIESISYLASGEVCLEENLEILKIQEGLEYFETLKNFKKISSGFVADIRNQRSLEFIDEREL